MNNGMRKNGLWILLFCVAAAAFVCFFVLFAIRLASAENGGFVFPISVLLIVGIASSATLLSIGASFLLRGFKGKK